MGSVTTGRARHAEQLGVELPVPIRVTEYRLRHGHLQTDGCWRDASSRQWDACRPTERLVPRWVVVGDLGYDVSFTRPKSYSLPPAFADSDIPATVEAVYTEAGGAPDATLRELWQAEARAGGWDPGAIARRMLAGGGPDGADDADGPRDPDHGPPAAGPQKRRRAGGGRGPRLSRGVTDEDPFAAHMPSGIVGRSTESERGRRDDFLMDGCHSGRCRGRGAGAGNLGAHRPTVRAWGGVAVRPAPHQGPPARPDLPPAVPDRPADPGQHPDRHHVGHGHVVPSDAILG